MPVRDPSQASVPVRLVQSLANTLTPQADVLATQQDAAAWLRAAALLPGEGALSNSEHAALLRLREALRDVLAAHTDGRQDDAAASVRTARLTRALADGRVVVTVDPSGAVLLASAARSAYPSVVAAVAVAIAESAAEGTWPRLKSCAAPGCGAAFYDASAPAADTWCAAHAGQGQGT